MKKRQAKMKLQEEASGDYEERTPTTRYEPDYEEGLTSRSKNTGVTVERVAHRIGRSTGADKRKRSHRKCIYIF